MTVQEWNLRYQTSEHSDQDSPAPPTPLVKYWTDQLAPGNALDLACGTGRNALYLAAQGWTVKAVDGAEAAIARLCERAHKRNLNIQSVIADLTNPKFVIQPESWDVILACYYLQRDLFAAIRRGVRIGGLVIAIVHLVDEGQRRTETRAEPGELLSYFSEFDIHHYYEGASKDPSHGRSVAEIAAVKKTK